MVCSYFEQVQSSQNYFWTKKEALEKLDTKMTRAFLETAELAHKKTLFMRDAAYEIAIRRVVEACRARGWV